MSTSHPDLKKETETQSVDAESMHQRPQNDQETQQQLTNQMENLKTNDKQRCFNGIKIEKIKYHVDYDLFKKELQARRVNLKDKFPYQMTKQEFCQYKEFKKSKENYYINPQSKLTPLGILAKIRKDWKQKQELQKVLRQITSQQKNEKNENENSNSNQDYDQDQDQSNQSNLHEDSHHQFQGNQRSELITKKSGDQVCQKTMKKQGLMRERN